MMPCSSSAAVLYSKIRVLWHAPPTSAHNGAAYPHHADITCMIAAALKQLLDAVMQLVVVGYDRLSSVVIYVKNVQVSLRHKPLL
jgi:hypothetical protein